LCLALSTSALHAQELSEEGRAAMTERVASFNEIFASGDMGAVFDYMPPKVLESLATQSGVDQATLIEMSKAQIDQAMAMVKIDSFSMDVDAATYQMTPDGSLGYVLIPTETVMTVEGAGKMKATGDTLAFEDGGEWYLARVDDPGQAAILQAAYPAFAGITFKPGVMEPVAE
ncbi:hypothetical protein, partial [Tabrizicola sp.]|uniref:hypothetical protein n=1 Tax=Tabrizicola sp. TaxID=2005166 RepID=UPI003F39343B